MIKDIPEPVPGAARLASAIRERRSAIGLTQADLATAVGFAAAQTVSDIERGRREVKAWELVQIARTLRTSPDELLELTEAGDPARVLWRRGSTAASPELEARFLDRARRYATLEKWNALPDPPQLPQLAVEPTRATFRDAARLATTVGRALDLGSRPAAALSAVLEEGFRIKLFYENLGAGASAACARGDFGSAILVNAEEAPWRRNYNLAHEIFHLVTWDATQGWWGEDGEPAWLEHVERLANAFASHLLLPAEDVETHFAERFPDGEIEFTGLVEMAREFDVSTEALVWRLRYMGHLTQEEAESILADPEFRRADRRTMPLHWRRVEAGRFPERYWRLALNAYRRGEVSLGRLASMLEISVSEAAALLAGEADDAGTPTAAPA